MNLPGQYTSYVVVAGLFFALIVIWAFYRFRAFTRKAPLSGNFAPLKEGEIYFTSAGAGPPIICLHGLGASSYIWKPLQTHLSKSFRLIAPDLMGFGRSTKDIRLGYGLDEQAQRIIDFLDHLKIPKARLVGSSMGGALALWLARLEPDRFFQVAVISPATHPKLVPPGVQMLRPVTPFLRLGTNSLTMKWALRRVRSTHHTIDPETLGEYLSPYRDDPKTFTTFLKATRLIRDRRLPLQLTGIRAKVLIVWPKRDRVVPYKYMEELCQVLPQAQLLIHEEGGHHLMEDDPEWLAEKLVEFFYKQS